MNGPEHGDLGIVFVNERYAPPTEHEPSMNVHSWRLLKAPSGELHLGTLRDQQTDRALVRLDIAARAVTTASGRRYVLMEPPEGRPLECMAICNGAAQLGLVNSIDISTQLWEQMQATG